LHFAANFAKGACGCAPLFIFWAALIQIKTPRIHSAMGNIRNGARYFWEIRYFVAGVCPKDHNCGRKPDARRAAGGVHPEGDERWRIGIGKIVFTHGLEGVRGDLRGVGNNAVDEFEAEDIGIVLLHAAETVGHRRGKKHNGLQDEHQNAERGPILRTVIFHWLPQRLTAVLSRR